MTPDPISIRAGSKVSEAKQILSRRGIKHLPVVDDNDVVTGILSDRDIKLHQAVSDDPNFHVNAEVIDVMVKFPYCVSPETFAAEVANHMYEENIGSALVVDTGKLVGIFTTMDACRVLAAILKQEET